MQQQNLSQPDFHLDLNSLHTPDIIHASNASDHVFAAWKRLSEKAPRVHCLTNTVTMNDVANILLAIGGSAIMAQCTAEAAQITAICHATLLNTGTPSDTKFAACCLAGTKARQLGHPVVLDPVGVGASTYRQEKIRELLLRVHPDLIRCNLEEALTLLALSGEANKAEKNKELVKSPNFQARIPESADVGKENGLKDAIQHGGVESGVKADANAYADTAARLARTYRTNALVSGSTDAISDGKHTALVTGGDARIARITGSGCMLSAICAALLAAGECGYDAALDGALFWKQAAKRAGQETDAHAAGMGSFRMYLLDAATNPDCSRF